MAKRRKGEFESPEGEFLGETLKEFKERLEEVDEYIDDTFRNTERKRKNR